MGVPSFYRWLVNKYPRVVVNAIEEKGETVDSSQPNPNGMEFDNLYLDMNGIIHPCFHPEDLFLPTTFEEVFRSIFEYIDRLFCIVRPRKLLYLAIDGVAPRAKMNQQRSRRFRAAKDAEIAEAEEDRLRKEFEMAGKKLLPKLESEVSDSNIITPGTDFMYKLSKALQYYIRLRLSNDPGWKNIKVILSDANVPGEGEHKIMSYIRLQRNLPGYNPNIRHCLYGLDADLIMLALATHEVHFSILREDVLMQEQRPSRTLDMNTNFFEAESRLVKSSEWLLNVLEKKGSASIAKTPYQFVNMWTLREYLELDLKVSDLGVEIDVERIIDDFIFICFLTGNDFLPHMPSLEIHEGAIDLLISVYKEEFKKLGGYLVDMSRVGEKKATYIKLKRVEKFILSVSTYEERIFKKRSEIRERKIRRLLRDNSDAVGVEELDTELVQQEESVHNVQDILITSTGITSSSEDSDVLKNTRELRQKLKEIIREKSDLFKRGSFQNDKIKLGTDGWKQRYYKEKFSAESSENIESMRKEIVKKYTEGLCWVLQYYFSGVPSWTWFYPYHYGPFASDLKGLAQVSISFRMGSPFRPLDQLMGVLPPRSVHALPKAYWDLMTCEKSNLINFYPTDFEVDTEGKRYMWQGVAKLKFIEEDHLLLETKKLEKELKEDEVNRNSQTADKLFVRNSHLMGSEVMSLYLENTSLKEQIKYRKPIDSLSSDGMNGFIRPCYEDMGSAIFVCSVKKVEMQGDDVICVFYDFPDTHLHIPRPPENVTMPEKMITEADILKTQLWHESEGWRSTNSRSHAQENYTQAQNRVKFASSGSTSVKDIFKGAGSGWVVRRGNHISLNSGQKFGPSRGMSAVNSGNKFDTSWGVGRGNHVSLNSGQKFGSSRGMSAVNRGNRFDTSWGRGESKDGSSGWVAARGKGYSESSNFNRNSDSCIRMQGLNRSNGTAPSPSLTKGCWKVVGSRPHGRGDGIEIDPLEISKSSQRQCQRYQQGNNGFWQSKNGLMDNNPHTWQSKQSAVDVPSGWGYGRGQSEQHTSVTR